MQGHFEELKILGWKGGSVGKGTCLQASQPKFDPWDPHWKERTNSYK